jgi:hypothetical protein
MKTNRNVKAGRAIRGSKKRFGSKGAPSLVAIEASRKAEKKPRLILSAVILANGEEAIVTRHPDGTYDIAAESSTYWRVSEELYSRLLPAQKRAYPREYPRQFVRMEQGGLPSLGKKR